MRNKISGIMILSAVIILLFNCSLFAQEKKNGGMPPAKVVVDEIKTGMIVPESLFIGSVYYAEVSDIAAEVSGKVEDVHFNEGKRVKKGKILVKLSTDILTKTLQSTRASYEQVLAELEKSKLDLNRIENLYKQESIAEQVYDENRFRVKALGRKAESLNADVERLEIEIEKKIIKSPFNGVVIKRNVDVGEWLSPGGVVATIARDNEVDVVVNVPQNVVGFIKAGLGVKVDVGTQTFKGKVFAIVPRGDIATRTFPVKIRMKNSRSLKEGMEARVKLPSGKKENALIVPRDAVITAFGRTVIYTVQESKAKMIPVEVVGYKVMAVGIRSQGLQQGMKVVVKGNERLRDGQAVVIE